MIHVKETNQNSDSTADNPKAFIRNDQYNFIMDQTKILVAGQTSTNDAEVLNVLRHLAHEKVHKLFPSLTEQQRKILQPLVQVRERSDAEVFLERLQPYIIPFKAVTEQGLKKLFPKAKKLKGPKLENINFSRTSYLAWTESSNLMYLVSDENGQLIGVQGSFSLSGKQGICRLCNRHSRVGMFVAKTKSSGQDQFIKRGNYICQDAEACNENIKALDRLNEFIGQFQN
ncbi:fibronectin-binding family protein [Planococcus antarcticus DSM 14505]|uniref:Elongation factor G-binding protein n=1 Tax=Planococcus antarcticus DSM 14505 TaxID=1185653 RepID=A0A1C7DDQ4_9BACL|nr:elongation factor G-binding protein [Planococcus antarcticus]ANU09575.1 elongation factor G-binding protein [Planococcus antarcticus DSM 14505]EIM08220.1 fibronectin-binding family protein [Planococcus antarcticus DSM 14505]